MISDNGGVSMIKVKSTKTMNENTMLTDIAVQSSIERIDSSYFLVDRLGLKEGFNRLVDEKGDDLAIINYHPDSTSTVLATASSKNSSLNESVKKCKVCTSASELVTAILDITK